MNIPNLPTYIIKYRKPHGMVFQVISGTIEVQQHYVSPCMGTERPLVLLGKKRLANKMKHETEIYPAPFGLPVQTEQLFPLYASKKI